MANRPDPEAELILYAVPVGPLAEAIDAFFAAVTAHPTTAQDYPPHCTLTGFFHDDAGSIERYVAAAAGVVRPVDVAARLDASAEWIGLEIESSDLQELTRDFADAARDVPTRRDAIRPKAWLHLSLAYGHDPADTRDLADLATELVNPLAEVEWHLRVYERRDCAWIVHGSWPLFHPADADDSTG